MPTKQSSCRKAGDLVIYDGRIWHRVAPSPVTGASCRRVMYIPMIVGKFQPKNGNSSTPLYHLLLPLLGVSKGIIPALKKAA